MEQEHASSLPPRSFQEEQVDLLQNHFQPRYSHLISSRSYTWSLQVLLMRARTHTHTHTPAPGCSQCHQGITIGDWRDPLDPDLDAQIIYSQFCQGKNTMLKKYLPSYEEEGSASTRDSSTSPTSMTSFGAISLQDQDSGGGGAPLSAAGQSAMETYCRDLLEVIEELSWHHSQISMP